eukprot:1683407-Pyramimonas_sp.AAC.3
MHLGSESATPGPIQCHRTAELCAPTEPLDTQHGIDVSRRRRHDVYRSRKFAMLSGGVTMYTGHEQSRCCQEAS